MTSTNRNSPPPLPRLDTVEQDNVSQPVAADQTSIPVPFKEQLSALDTGTQQPSTPIVPIQGRPNVPTASPTTQQPLTAFPVIASHPVVSDASADIVSQQSASEVPPDEEPEEPWDTPFILRSAPPWMVSLAAHMVLLIFAGIFFIPNAIKRSIEVEVSYAVNQDDQLLDEDDLVPIEKNLSVEIEEPVLTPDNLTPVEEPLAAPTDLAIVDNANFMSRALDVPHIGLALNGREPGMKQALLEAYGGNSQTEEAVRLALKWFKRNQQADGSWSLKKPFSAGGSGDDNTLAATAMALLAFQGAGMTHQRGPYQQEVQKGWNSLLKTQNANGDFWTKGHPHARLYSQAQATIALCELYGMTKDDNLREPAQQAIQYAISIQDELGGWRYTPGVGSDTSVTGWFVMALQSARMAGLHVDSDVFLKVERFLDAVADAGGAQYGYMVGHQGTLAMTAEGLLCRQYLGWQRKDPRLVEGVGLLKNSPIRWNEKNVYYWYYATQVLHHMEGDAWDSWNTVLREIIPKHQNKFSKERGSWDPNGDPFEHRAGRLYVTALCTYMLEVYYRHLPIYSELYKHLGP